MKQSSRDRRRKLRAKLSGSVLAAVLAALVLASPASAWKVVLGDFVNPTIAVHSVAKKCKGGKEGYYDWTLNGASPSGSFAQQLEAQLPVFSKWRQMKDVSLQFYGEAFTNLPPEHQVALLNGYGTFYETMFTRYSDKKDKLFFRHQGVILFGSYLFGPGESEIKFKPKRGC